MNIPRFELKAAIPDSQWTILGDAESPGRIICRCVCGKVKEVYKYSVTDGRSKSCGCKRFSWRPTPLTPEESRTRSAERKKKEYALWKEKGLCIRCGNPRSSRSKSRCEDCLEYARHDRQLRRQLARRTSE